MNGLNYLKTNKIMKQENCCTPIGQVKRHANCNTCHLKPKQKIDISKYTLGIDPYDKKQSALKWLVTELFAYREPNSIEIQLIKHAQEMEKEQQDEFAIAFAEYVLDWNRDTTSDYLQIILEQFKNK